MHICWGRYWLDMLANVQGSESLEWFFAHLCKSSRQTGTVAIWSRAGMSKKWLTILFFTFFRIRTASEDPALLLGFGAIPGAGTFKVVPFRLLLSIVWNIFNFGCPNLFIITEQSFNLGFFDTWLSVAASFRLPLGIFWFDAMKRNQISLKFKLWTKIVIVYFEWSKIKSTGDRSNRLNFPKWFDVFSIYNFFKIINWIISYLFKRISVLLVLQVISL